MKQSKNLTTGEWGNDVQFALQTEHNVYAVPRLTVDWNLNRYTLPTADNTPAEIEEGFDVECFPISSIVEPIRPTKGILKARVGQAVVSPSYQHPKDPKFYVGDQRDVYKYWTSPYTTDGIGNFPLHAADGLTSARPHVIYDRVVQANKIVIKVDNTWATPANYTVHIRTTVNGAWSGAIAGNSPAMNLSTGVLTLYYNGTAWVTTRPQTLVETNVAGIQFRVGGLSGGIKRDGTAMTYLKATNNPGQSNHGQLVEWTTTGSNASLNVIAIEPHLEIDMTDRLIENGEDFELADHSELYPVGTITTNQASVTLANEDNIFNKDNDASPYQYLLEPNAEFNLEYIYTIDGTDYSVQGFKMFGGVWTTEDGTVSIELDDASKFLKETKPRPLFYEDKSSNELIWRVLDSVGFVDYEIQADDLVVEHKIPFFWGTGEETVWELLDEIAHATQTAIYFDSYGILQVRTRSAAFRDTAVADMTLYGQTNWPNLANIAENGLQISGEYVANRLTVPYYTTHWKTGTNGDPAMSNVWEPEGETMVVRSSPLVRSFTATDPVFFFDQKEVKLWPYKSKVQINGEVIEYDGKQFIYYTDNAETKNVVVVKSDDEQKKYDNITPYDYRHLNHFTGAVYITKRGVWNTTAKQHEVEVNGWDNKAYIAGQMTSDVSGFRHKKEESMVQIKTPGRMKDEKDHYFVNRGNPSGTGYEMYGTRLRFNGQSGTQRAGLAFNKTDNENGYYIEVVPSERLTAEERSRRNEVSIFHRQGQEFHLIATGAPVAVAPDIYYDLDVRVRDAGDQHQIRVWFNGQLVADATTTSAEKKEPTGKVGMYARGKSDVSYEYFYAIDKITKEPADDYGFYDLLYGGVRGDTWEREYVWETRTRYKKIKKQTTTKETIRHNIFLFDEFGPYVHEVREFDIKFSPAPVQYSRLFSTNEWYAATLEYGASAFDAHFIVANVGRNHAILKGEDTLLFAGTSATVNQVFMVLGRDLEVADEETIIKRNEQSIRARGIIDTELSSDWMQSKEMAEAVADWIQAHWSMGVDELTVEIFGNPLVEVADVVEIDYEIEHMTPATHRYFVTGISNSWESGISTTLTLRRINQS